MCGQYYQLSQSLRKSGRFLRISIYTLYVEMDDLGLNPFVSQVGFFWP